MAAFDEAVLLIQTLGRFVVRVIIVAIWTFVPLRPGHWN